MRPRLAISFFMSCLPFVVVPVFLHVQSMDAADELLQPLGFRRAEDLRPAGPLPRPARCGDRRHGLATSRANFISWVTRIMVRPSRARSPITFSTSPTSSRIERRGRLVEQHDARLDGKRPGDRARAAAGRRTGTPDRRRAFRKARRARAASRRVAIASSRLTPSTWTGTSMTFSISVMWLHRLKLWNTMPSCERMRSICRRSAGTVSPWPSVFSRDLLAIDADRCRWSDFPGS